MRFPSLLAAVLSLSLTGCTLSPAAISALSAAALNGAGQAEPAQPQQPVGETPAPTVAPTTKPSAAPAIPKASAAAVEAFAKKVEAAHGDPRVTAQLFMAGLVAYEKDAALGRALMTLVVVDGDVQANPTSPSGLAFISPREIYFRTLDRNPALGRAYLDEPASADGADVETHVVIDDAYAAVDKGVNEEAGTAKFFIKLNELGAGKRPRPLSLKRVEGVWRVSEYSSVFVQI